MNLNKADREVAIYWDYENVPLPQWCSAAEAAKRISHAVSKYGNVIVERRLYFDYQRHSSKGPHDCSGLDLSGFDLVNTPTRNKKETLDKKLIADVLTFAWDCSTRKTKPCVVLITSDGDYAYTLAKLRDRGVMSIVMFGTDFSVAKILVENAHVALSFSKYVLGVINKSSTGSDAKPAVGGTGRDKKQPSRPTKLRSIVQPARDLSQAAQVIPVDFIKCCVCLHNEQLHWAIQRATKAYQRIWVPISPFMGCLHVMFANNLTKDSVKSLTKSIVEKSNLEGFIAIARQRCDTEGEYVSVPWHKNRGLRADLSTEAYLRLTAKGRLLVQNTFRKKNVDEILCSRTKESFGVSSISSDEKPPKSSSSSDPSTLSISDTSVFLYFTNLPNATNVDDFVKFIEYTCYVPVERAVLCPSTIEIDFSVSVNAYLQITTHRGLAIVILAVTEGITFNGNKINVCTRGDLASMLEKMSNSVDIKLCYFKTKNASSSPKTLVALPNTTWEAEDVIRVKVKTTQRHLCTHLLRAQKAVGNTQLFPYDQCWVPYSIIGTSFRSTRPFQDLPKQSSKELLKVTRDMSIHDGLIETGRQKLFDNRGYVSIPWFENRGQKESLSTEFYLRLTDAGLSLLQSTDLRKKNTGCVLLQNLPWPVQIANLVRFLEVDFHAIVQRSSIEYHDSNDWCSAHVEFVHAEDGSRICRNDKPIYYLGKQIIISSDTRTLPKDSVIEKNTSFLYIKDEGMTKSKVCESTISETGQLFTKENSSVGVNDVVVIPDTVVVTNGIDVSTVVTGGSNDDTITIQTAGITNPLFETSLIGSNIDAESLDALIATQYFQDTSSNDKVNLCDDKGSSHGVASVGSGVVDVMLPPLVDRKSMILDSYCQTSMESPTSKLVILKKELDKAVQMKCFSKASTIQADIDCLENETASNSESESLLRSEFDEELNRAVVARKFAKAAIIQSHIEGLEKGTLSEIEANVILMKTLDEELNEAIKSKDFVNAGKIHSRIERLEQAQ